MPLSILKQSQESLVRAAKENDWGPEPVDQLFMAVVSAFPSPLLFVWSIDRINTTVFFACQFWRQSNGV